MQGISIYERPGRPTLYIAYDCPRRLKRVNESSGIGKDEARARSRAYAIALERSESGTADVAPKTADRWENWVEPWLRVTYAGPERAKTLASYLGAWKFLRVHLHEQKVWTPAQLRYEHLISFVHWRETQVKKQSGRKVSRNTALHNIVVLSRIMREAVRRGYCQGNPCHGIGQDLPRARVKPKPEYTDAQIEQIRAELRRRRTPGRPSAWMADAFEIALYTGCRLGATAIPMERIDFANQTIQFHEKGRNGEPAVFTVPIHPHLLPLLRQWRAEGRTVTCTLPRFASRNFSRVLRSLGLPHTFHCSRVTVITRMARHGVPIQQAMAAVHHGSWAVHNIYQRLKPADVRGVHAAIRFATKPRRVDSA